jgi:protein-disulfide isomerase
MSKKRVSRGGGGPTTEIGPGGLLAVLTAVGLLVVVGMWFLGRASVGAPASTAASTPAFATSAPNAIMAPAGAGAGAGAALTPEPGTWLTPANEPAIGSPSAPVTIVAYLDYQCPNCRQFATEVLPWMRKGWIAQGFVKVVLRDFAIRGLESYQAAEGAYCAGEQGRYWTFMERLYAAQAGENGGAFGPENLARMAEAAGLNRAGFTDCLASGRYRARVEASTQEAHGKGYEGTPVYEINGRKVQGALPVDSWQELFQAFTEDFQRATAAAATARPAPAASATATGP